MNCRGMLQEHTVVGSQDLGERLPCVVYVEPGRSELRWGASIVTLLQP